MIVSALVALCLTAPSAAADTDFTLSWRSGEMSRDASHFETTWTLQGSTLTQHSSSIRAARGASRALQVIEQLETLRRTLFEIEGLGH